MSELKGKKPHNSGITVKMPVLLLRSGIASLVLLLALSLFTSTAATAGPNEGETIFTAKCVSCHSINKPATRPTIDEALNEKGPNLWYAGSKYKDGFIEGWLKNPTPLRGMEYNSLTEKAKGGHLALNEAEAAEVASYLQSLTSPDVADVDIKVRATVRGRFIFQKKFGCYGCHTIRRGAKLVGGLTGPTLTGTAERLNPQWVYSYLKNPRAFSPISPMPNYSGLLSEVKLKALVGYVSAQK